jgi:rhodanese-related sulfurtransferase
MPIVISRDELVARLATGEPLTIVEALGPDFYADAHLPGAVNIPVALARAIAPLLLPDRDAPVVVYCSRTCDESEQLAAELESMGYGDVAVYAGGKEDWIEAGLAVERGA